jgi:DNA-binding MarR family transcriptional regulator
MVSSNFARLEAEGLIAEKFDFSDDDRRAIEDLSEEEVQTIIRTVKKLVPNWTRESAKAFGPGPRGIIL